MSNDRAIDPAIRALLEEVANGPRSALRAAPKRALAPWLFSDEKFSARDITSSRFERHLVEAHREALAQLLYEAARIAYWKAPVLAHPWQRNDDTLIDAATEDRAWRIAAQRYRVQDAGASDLVRRCTQGVRPEYGPSLARASLQLVPRDETRSVIACQVAIDTPRSALRLFERLVQRSSGTHRSLALTGLASQLCQLQQYESAKKIYEEAAESEPRSYISLLNLALVTGDRGAVRQYGEQVGSRWLPSAPVLSSAVVSLSAWARGMPTAQLHDVRRFIQSIRAELPTAAGRIGEAYA